MVNDNAFKAMADPQRRSLLVELHDDGPLRVPELTGVSRELSAANEAFLDEYLSGSVEVADADEDLVRMHLVHLPTLAEDGFVEWDSESNVVKKGPRFDEVRPLLDLVDYRRVDHPVVRTQVPSSQ